ncbi:MAG: FHA domain-containing protein, partial [Gammaproteobacteria bacterium]
MKAILEPISHPELGPIVSGDGCMLPIGRSEPPFDSQACDAAAKLSRRHARIFQRGNIVYLAELGSTNGTHVNGRAVHQRPVRLMPGDEICFGGEIRFRLEVDADDTRPMATLPAHLRLTLTPKNDNLGLQTVVVTGFPFVIDKTGDVFSRYRKQFPKEFAHLSRRHAVIYQKGEQLLVEDLASKNGTFVCGERLEQELRPLRHGDDIAFAHNSIFDYTVSISGAASKSKAHKEAGSEARIQSPPRNESPSVNAEPETPAPDHTESRTTFVTTAASFLDIFCHDDEGDAEQGLNPESDPQSGKEQPQCKRRQARPPGRMRRFGRMARELKGALEDEEPRRRGPLAVLAGLLVVTGVAAYALHYQGATERGLDALLESGAYSQALRQAQTYLARHPDDADVREIATEALLKHVVTPWQQLLSERAFDDAAELLTEAAGKARSDEVALESIETLRWIGDLQAFMSWRKVDDSFFIFTDAGPIRSLLDRWDAGSEKNRRSMSLIARYVPDFEATQSKALSHLRMLRSQESLYVAATAALEQTILAKLEAGDGLGLKPVFENFAKRYPNIDGMDRLWDDLIRYLAIDAQVQARNMTKLAALLKDAEFRTPPFRDYAANSLAQKLPPESVLERYQQVSLAWRAGETSQALSKLEALVGAPWGDVATKLLARHRSVLQKFKELNGRPDNADYDERLLAFYSTLDPYEDAHFVRELRVVFQTNKQRA